MKEYTIPDLLDRGFIVEGDRDSTSQYYDSDSGVMLDVDGEKVVVVEVVLDGGRYHLHDSTGGRGMRGSDTLSLDLYESVD
jgi:hypothetical protein